MAHEKLRKLVTEYREEFPELMAQRRISGYYDTMSFLLLLNLPATVDLIYKSSDKEPFNHYGTRINLVLGLLEEHIYRFSGESSPPIKLDLPVVAQLQADLHKMQAVILRDTSISSETGEVLRNIFRLEWTLLVSCIDIPSDLVSSRS